MITCSSCGKDLEEESVYITDCPTLKVYCRGCWDRVDCELYHKEGCSTNVYSIPPVKCLVDGEAENE